MQFQVIFTYCELSRKWEVLVKGAESGIHARQGFSAVVLTCQKLNPRLLTETKWEPKGNDYNITPIIEV